MKGGLLVTILVNGRVMLKQFLKKWTEVGVATEYPHCLNKNKRKVEYDGVNEVYLYLSGPRSITGVGSF
jgi:hypothetical protein